MAMKTGREAPAVGSVFSRLIESSRRLLGQTQTATAQELNTLSSLIEQEIIPRLHMRFSSTSAQAASPPDSAEVEYDVDGFVAALLAGGGEDSEQYHFAEHVIDQLRLTEHSLVEIYEHLIAPAARQLGVRWEDDDCSFADVTVAVTKMRHILLSTAPLFPVHTPTALSSSILLTTVPGEQHTLGLFLAVETFREHDWRVWSGTPRSLTELVELVAQERYDAIGVSIGSGRTSDEISAAITEIRRASANPDVTLIAGGYRLGDREDLADALAVDLILDAVDEPAIQRTTDLVEQRRGPRS